MLWGQFDPPADQPGSLAIPVNSPLFIAWATTAEVIAGPQQIGVDSLGLAASGQAIFATGKAGENPVVSLGDGGNAIVQFEFSVRNGIGADFAVFENSFDGFFLELAFVEVSSDGINFYRFPSASLTDTTIQASGFSNLDAKNLNNLAGKHAMLFGTPFDLEELSTQEGLDINAISHIRIVDVVGSINPDYGSRDAFGRIINDPFPTPFISSGFDLDAVGVIHNNDPNAIEQLSTNGKAFLFPQPAEHSVLIQIPNTIGKSIHCTIKSLEGKNVLSIDGTMNSSSSIEIETSSLIPGYYFIESTIESTVFNQKLIIRK